MRIFDAILEMKIADLKVDNLFLQNENILLKNEIHKLQVNLGDDSAIAQYEQTIADLQDYVAILLEEIDVLKTQLQKKKLN